MISIETANEAGDTDHGGLHFLDVPQNAERLLVARAVVTHVPAQSQVTPEVSAASAKRAHTTP